MLLSPSMMCANFANLEKEVADLEAAGIDMFHMDIMDGMFVPNYGMGLQDYEYIGKVAKVPVDVHMMVEDPIKHVQLFADLGASLIYIHPEADKHPLRTINLIHELGKKAGIAVDPDTSFECVLEILPHIDAVLLMTVNPGFAGQKFIEGVIPKIKKFCSNKNENEYIVGVDGAISPQKIEDLSKLGVDNFILGTSALFGKEKSYKNVIENLKKLG